METNLKDHAINLFDIYGELDLSDIPPYAETVLSDLFTQSEPLLTKTLATIKELRETDYSGYKESYAAKLRNERLLEIRLELHQVLKKFMEQSQENRDRITRKIKSYSLPTKTDNVSDQLFNQLRQQEIRSLLRNKELPEIKAILQHDIEQGNGEFLSAIANSPDRLVPETLLYDFQRKWAFRQNPDLEQYEQQVNALQKIVREKSAQLNSSQSIMILKSEMSDPISKRQHFECFQPRNENELHIAQQLIESEERRQKLIEDRQRFDEQNPGVNMS